MKNKKRKEQKIRIKKIGLRRKTTLFFWVLLLASVSFGVYKNFTAIDQHTTHEKEIVKTKLVDTNLVSTYVKDFAKIFYAWTPEKEALAKRTENLKNYLTEDLQQLNQEAIRSDIPTKSIVTDVKIWQVEKKEDNLFQVLYTVAQRIEETKDKKVETKVVESTYQVDVYEDGNQNLVIVSNPQLAAAPKKADYKEDIPQDSNEIPADTREEITDFLVTFFKLYPQAEEKELSYYVADDSLKAIKKEMTFVGIHDTAFLLQKEKIVTIQTTVQYMDKETGMTIYSSYQLHLKKTNGTWQIASGDPS